MPLKDLTARREYDKTRRPKRKITREASRANNAKWRRDHPEKYAAYCERTNENRRNLRRDFKTWGTAAIVSIRQRARRLGLECTITAGDLVVPAMCPVLGIPIFYAGGKHTPNSPSADRFDNAVGYTAENIRVISNRANSLKRDATVDELRRVLAYMTTTKGVPNDSEQGAGAASESQ